MLRPISLLEYACVASEARCIIFGLSLYCHTLCVQAVNAFVRLHGCTGSSMLPFLASAISTNISCTKSNTLGDIVNFKTLLVRDVRKKRMLNVKSSPT